jgi:DNA-binding Xre family transcriptional regulator
MGINEAIANRIRVIVAVRATTAKAVFERSGLSASTASRRMTGRSAWTTDELADIADVLAVSVADLLVGGSSPASIGAGWSLEVSREGC